MVAFAPRSFEEPFCFASFDEIPFVIGKNARLPQRKWKCQWQWCGLDVLRTPKLKLPYNPRFLYDESRPVIPRKIRKKSSCDSIIWLILDQKKNCCPFFWINTIINIIIYSINIILVLGTEIIKQNPRHPLLFI